MDPTTEAAQVSSTRASGTDASIAPEHAAEGAAVPTVITAGADHRISYANQACLQLTYGAREVCLRGLPFEALSREPERVRALLDRVLTEQRIEFAPEVAYIGPSAPWANTLVSPVSGQREALLIHLLECPKALARGAEAQAARELKQANERLLLASLREHELAERAQRSASEIEELLGRKSVLAEANALLSSSLDMSDTLQKVVALPVPELADCCVVELLEAGEPQELAVAHVDKTVEKQLRSMGRELCRDARLAQLRTEILRTALPYSIAAPLSSHAEAPVGDREALLLGTTEAHALLAVPLLARGAVIGMLTLLARRSSRGFEPVDVEFTQELARRASIAIDNARLYRDARQASAMRDDVLAVVSHDLRSPLTAITLSTVRLLRREQLDNEDAIRKALKVVESSALRMRRLIEELLEVASIQAGRLTVERREESLDELIDEALAMLAPQARMSMVHLDRRAQEPGISVWCDKERVIRVLSNLLGNAMKFTPSGGYVSVSCARLEQEVRVEVRDTGPGVSEADVAKLFDPYWKGARTGRGGMGLGLYIARGIVQAHGGRIWVETQEGAGSTFCFTLPLTAPGA